MGSSLERFLLAVGVLMPSALTIAVLLWDKPERRVLIVDYTAVAVGLSLVIGSSY